MCFAFHFVLLKSFEYAGAELFFKFERLPDVISLSIDVGFAPVVFGMFLNGLNLQHV